MDDAFEIKLTVNDGIGILEWAGQTDQATLDRGVSLAADDALIGRGVDRLEVQIPADDQMAMRALHRARFRREGRRRKAVRGPDGSWRDVLVYARLAIDQVYGPDGFSGVMNTVLPTHRIIGHVLFRDEAGRILLVDSSKFGITALIRLAHLNEFDVVITDSGLPEGDRDTLRKSGVSLRVVNSNPAG